MFLCKAVFQDNPEYRFSLPDLGGGFAARIHRQGLTVPPIRCESATDPGKLLPGKENSNGLQVKELIIEPGRFHCASRGRLTKTVNTVAASRILTPPVCNS